MYIYLHPPLDPGVGSDTLFSPATPINKNILVPPFTKARGSCMHQSRTVITHRLPTSWSN